MDRDQEKREAFRLHTLRAYEEYQATGLHATVEEVYAWLESLGTDHELPVPVCHK
jgi:predicted transcriptional regulator